MSNSNHRPLVSVIIPGYNHAPYLCERIESVLLQDYPCFEVIMLDDCSPDNSAEIMQGYADDFSEGRLQTNASSVTFHPNVKNSGNTFLQWEKGINLAKGELIWIAESDDVADHSFLTKVTDKLMEHDDAVLAFSWSRMIGPDGKDLGYSWDETERYKAPGVYDGRDFCLRRMTYKNLLYNASMIVFRKESFGKVNDDYKQFSHCGDWLFWFEVCQQGSVCEIPEKRSVFRQHPNKVSNDSRKTGADFIEMAAIQQHIRKKLELSAYQRSCLRGRQTKRLNKSECSNKDELRRRFPEIYGGTFLDILLYTIDKSINHSHLQR